MNVTDVASFPTYAKVVIGLMASCVSTATLAGNIVVLLAFFVESSLRIPSNHFIASLAVTDVLIGLISMNLFITYQLLGFWPFNQVLCDIWLSLDFSACLTSQYTVFLITVDRYCSVKIPVSYRNWRTLTKVRWMICISWIFPAGLFAPVILGWKKLTSEPPRADNKCDVSFTYYPAFNTTLIVGYFWTTLVVMCSLYIGIYKVAKRLQRKSLETTEKFAAIFKIPHLGSRNQQHRTKESKNDSENTDLRKATRSSTALDSGFKESCTAAEKQFSNEMKNRIEERERNTSEQEQDDRDSNGIQKLVDHEHNDFPKRTAEEQLDLTKLQSPNYPVQENAADVIENCAMDKTKRCLSTTSVTKTKCLSLVKDAEQDRPSSQLLTSNCKPYAVSVGMVPATISSETRTEQPSRQWENDSCSLESDLSNIVSPINKFIPSPLVPVYGMQESSANQQAEVLCEPDSPVWVENSNTYSSMKEMHFCLQCYHTAQVISSGYPCGRTVSQFYSGCKSSSAEIVCYSEFSSSEQNESSDYVEENATNFLCAYHANLLCPELHGFSPSYSESSLSDSEEPSFRQKLLHSIKFRLIPSTIDNPCTSKRRSKSFGFGATQCKLPRKEGRSSVDDNCYQVLNALNRKIRAINLSWNSLVHRLAKRWARHDKKDMLQRQINLVREEKDERTREKRILSRGLSQMRSLSGCDSNNRRQARKALRTISFILGAFMLCWIPYHIIMMIKGFCDDLITQSSCVSHHLYGLSYWLCYMNSPINPFCYALSNASFRRTFFRILKGNFQRR